MSSRYLALLRGINVGGKNIIAKDDLRQCCEDLGLRNVRTYIQSGNILFRAEQQGVRKLAASIEQALSLRFSYDARAVVFARRKYQQAVAAAPGGWGRDETCKHNAMFTLNGVSAKKVLTQLTPPKTEIETVTAGPGVIFWSASKKQLTRTTLMKLAQEAVYQQLTVRNHNTVFKLLELFESI